jgi:antitoxin CptB
MTAEPIDIRRKRLLHRARYRGFKEADMLVGGFADAAIAGMGEAELDALEALLERSDHDIYAWIVAGEPTPPDIDCGLIDRMKAFDASARIRGA